ncbi:MAG: FAD-binding oxidoreductase [Alphaproteobacteria bacterium]|nr:FAD-binding oxidoreductase [Alphaproteobacteria bacterium]
MVALTSKDTYDVVIIGNGALGMGVAYNLRKRDPSISIAVVGPSHRKGGATVAAGAMINVWAEMAAGQYDNPALADRAELTVAAMELWDNYCADLSEFTEKQLEVKWGTYIVNNALGSPHEMKAVDYIVELMQKRQVPHQILDPGDVPFIKPEQKGQPIRIVRVPDGRIDSRMVLSAYERFFAVRDVDLFDDTAERLQVGLKLPFVGADKTITLASGTTLKTKALVMASGSFSQALIDQVPDLRREVPRLVWGAGSGLDISLPPWVHRYGGLDRSVFDIDAVIRTVDRGGACGVHLVPYGNGEFYLGSSSGVWFEPEAKPRVHAVHVLLRSLVEEINYAFFFATMSVRGPGFRPVSMDTFPLLGQSHIPGIWFANGTKRDGFTCSPYLCGEIANEILGGRSSLPKRFLPSRSLISYKTAAEAIEDYVAADFGGEVQHGLNLPPYALEPYRNMKRAKIKEIYDKRKIQNFGIHPELPHLYDNDEFFAACDHKREIE